MNTTTKGTGIGIVLILLFFPPLIGITTATNPDHFIDSTDAYLNNYENDLEKILVYEYKADGTKVKTIVEINAEDLHELQKEINNGKNKETRLSIFQKYGVIPKHVTYDSLREGMGKKAQNMGVTKNQLFQYTTMMGKNCNILNREVFTTRNFFCDVAGIYYGFGLRFLGGLSFFTSLYNGDTYANRLPRPNVTSIDCIDFTISYGLSIETENGLLPDEGLDVIFATSLTVGFVGYYMVIPYDKYVVTWEAYFEGSAVAVFARGIKPR